MKTSGLSEKAVIRGLGECFTERKYQLEGDVSGLPSQKQTDRFQFFMDNAVGTALKPFIEAAALVAWKDTEIVPVFFADAFTVEFEQQVLKGCLDRAKEAANGLSVTKYGGRCRVYPLLCVPRPEPRDFEFARPCFATAVPHILVKGGFVRRAGGYSWPGGEMASEYGTCTTALDVGRSNRPVRHAGHKDTRQGSKEIEGH